MKAVSFLENRQFGEKPQIEMLLETPQSKEIRICMDEGNTMVEHTAPGAIMIMVVEGSVAITSQGETILLKSGEMIGFEAKIPHSLQAGEKSVIRLTLSKNDTFSRVAALL